MRDPNLTDPELIDHRLDLSCPELRPILNRYFPRTALLVGRQGAVSSLKNALISAGWQIRGCEGPGRVRCPILEGKPACNLRQSADVAVVYVDAKETWPASGLLPRLRCAVDPASPAVVALEGRMDAPVTRKGYGIVGALRSPDTILKAVSAVTQRRTPS